MRIVVTGAAGQVGAALKQRLQSRSTIMATDRAALDLAKPDLIPTRLDALAPDLLINAAAYTHVDKAEDEPDLAETVNAKSPGIMARWAAQNDIPFIHFSSDYVFSGAGRRPWREDDPVQPLSVYGMTKLAGEGAVRAAGGSSLVIRTSWVYAARGVNFLCKIAELARTESELRVVADQVGAPTSAALIADAVGAMIGGDLARFRAKAQEASGTVHLAASGKTSWHQFATEIVEGLRWRGITLAVERVLATRSDERPGCARRPLNSRLDLTRLHTVFGITTPDWRAVLAPELDMFVQELARPSPRS